MQQPTDEAKVSSAQDQLIPSVPYRGYILFIAMLVGALTVFDRRILSMLIKPIRAEFNLNDSQLGLLMGVAFAVMYCIACIPAARLADRWSRRNVVALSVGAWSLMTLVCGVVQNFPQLFLARMGVGVGEAGGGAPMQAMISDNFPPKQRGTAFSVYVIGTSLGLGAGTAFGGWALEAFDWRWAFILAALPGLILAPLFWLTMPNSQAGLADGVSAKFDQRPLLETIRLLLSIRTIPLMLAAATLSAMIGMGLIDWMPEFFGRSHGLSSSEIGLKLGFFMATGSVVGHILGGPLADFQTRRNVRWHLLTPAILSLVGAGFAALAYTGTPEMAFPLLGLQVLLSGMFAAPMMLMMTSLAPVWARATSAALSMITLNLVGLGLGPWFVGMMSDVLRPAYGEDSLRIAMLCMLGLAIPVSFLFYLASRHYRADLETARALMNR